MTDGEFDIAIDRYGNLYGRPKTTEEKLELDVLIRYLDCDEVFDNPNRVKRLFEVRERMGL